MKKDSTVDLLAKKSFDNYKSILSECTRLTTSQERLFPCFDSSSIAAAAISLNMHERLPPTL